MEFYVRVIKQHQGAIRRDGDSYAVFVHGRFFNCWLRDNGNLVLSRQNQLTEFSSPDELSLFLSTLAEGNNGTN